MSSSNSNIYVSRRWMYERIDTSTNQISKAFEEGLQYFMAFATNQDLFRSRALLPCPCVKCGNKKLRKEYEVWNHLYRKGFTPNYYVWLQHGETYDYGVEEGGGEDDVEENKNLEDATTYVQPQYTSPYAEMVNDTLFSHLPPSSPLVMEEDPNAEAKNFYDMLGAANTPLYEGCVEGLSRMSLSSQLMNLKTDYNLPESCMDSMSQMFKQYLPEGNTATESYYETKNLMRTLGLPYQKIDVCEDNCMIFWKDDAQLMQCRFCGKDRYKQRRKSSAKNKLVPFKRMFYMPISERLKRLYQSEKTASHMRWHAEHNTPHGEMHHPSDGEAWKHFNQVFPRFARETRNVYLGLCTDGFNPFGMSGRNYSLWPVIMTPYNLPPDLCMKREFLFLSILVPGPNHPRRSLDIFLQPLIEELNHLWNNGVEAYDVDRKENFVLKAVLMWTISDFPALSMLSGWTTHGRLACPYCMEDTEAFQLKHGRKTSWFDCHRRFLPRNHTLRRNKKSFRKNKVVVSDPPCILTGDEILFERIEDCVHYYGLSKTVECRRNCRVQIEG